MHRVNRAYLYAVLVALTLIRISILQNMRVFDTAPDILIAAVIFSGLYFGRGKGFEAGLFAGFINDVLTVMPFGLGIACYALIGFFSGTVSEKVYKENFVTQSFLAFLAAFAFSFVCFASRLYVIESAGLARTFFRLALIHALYTAAAAPVIFFAMFRLFRVRETWS